jgi:hypothetical protein
LIGGPRGTEYPTVVDNLRASASATSSTSIAGEDVVIGADDRQTFGKSVGLPG